MLPTPVDFWTRLCELLDPRRRVGPGAAPRLRQTTDMGVETTIRRRRLEPALSICSAAETHCGLIRKANEDAVLDHGPSGVWAVADGVGGADAGGHASETIIQALGQLPAGETGAVLCGRAEETLRSVNRQLFEEASRAGSLRGMASTVVCLMIRSARFFCLWAGDSRLYRLRAGRFDQLSRDHTEVQTLLDYGLLTAEEAKNHPRGNLITRAVGATDELELDRIEGDVEPEDVFLLCSDGLTKVVDDHEIGLIVAQMDPAQAVHQLVRMTLERGAPDNVSVIAVQAALAARRY